METVAAGLLYAEAGPRAGATKPGSNVDASAHTVAYSCSPAVELAQTTAVVSSGPGASGVSAAAPRASSDSCGRLRRPREPARAGSWGSTGP
jgi:hypothetical protein